MAVEVKDTEAVVAEAAEKPAKATRKKAAAAEKEPAAKKAPAKKVEPKTSVMIEYAGKTVVAKDVLAAAQKAYKKANKGVVIKKIEIYIKPEENVAYYVVNGDASADYKVEL